MNKQQIYKQRLEVYPQYKNKSRQNIDDLPLMRESFNNFINSLHIDGEITDKQCNNICLGDFRRTGANYYSY